MIMFFVLLNNVFRLLKSFPTILLSIYYSSANQFAYNILHKMTYPTSLLETVLPLSRITFRQFEGFFIIFLLVQFPVW
jgi:hypothetical protein